MLLAMYIFGLLTIISSLGVVFAKKSLNSALCLVATLFFIAVHFALLNAGFLATLQIMVYAGAIMILVVFVIMLLGLENDMEKESKGQPKALSFLLVGVMFAFLSLSVFKADSLVLGNIFDASLKDSLSGTLQSDKIIGAKEIGFAMLTKHIAGFELAAVLLLAAVVGAVSIAYDPRPPLPKGRGLSAMRKNEEV